MNNSQKLILFDFDGVLLDTLQAGREKYSSILTQLGRHPLTDEEFEYMKRSSPSELLSHCLTDPELVKRGIELREKGEFSQTTDIAVFQGVHETLKNLSQDYVLGVVTSRDETVFDLLDQHNLSQYFKGGVVCNSDYSKDEFKPHPKPLQIAIQNNSVSKQFEEVVYVGDAETDYLAAQAANVSFVGFGDVGQINTTCMYELENLVRGEL